MILSLGFNSFLPILILANIHKAYFDLAKRKKKKAGHGYIILKKLMLTCRRRGVIIIHG
jgi:hypothetical protein